MCKWSLGNSILHVLPHLENSLLPVFTLFEMRPWPFTKLALNCISSASTVYAEAHPRGVNSSMQIAPPSMTNPFSMRGSTTRINGGEKGKLSGKIRFSRMCCTFCSAMSLANGESGSTRCSRTCHSYRLSFTSSTCNGGMQSTWVGIEGENKVNHHPGSSWVPADATTGNGVNEYIFSKYGTLRMMSSRHAFEWNIMNKSMCFYTSCFT